MCVKGANVVHWSKKRADSHQKKLEQQLETALSEHRRVSERVIRQASKTYRGKGSITIPPDKPTAGRVPNARQSTTPTSLMRATDAIPSRDSGSTGGRELTPEEIKRARGYPQQLQPTLLPANI